MTEVAALLINRGADVDLPDQNGVVALHKACIDGHVDTAALLLLHSAALNLPSYIGVTPLHDASYNGHVATVSLLLRQPRLLPSLATIQGYSPLNVACIMGHINVARQLMDHPRLAWPSQGEVAACGDIAIRALLQQRLAARARTCARCGETADAATVTPFSTALSCPVSRLCVCPGPKPGQNGPPPAVYCGVVCQRAAWREWKTEHPRLDEAAVAAMRTPKLLRELRARKVDTARLLEASELRAALLAVAARPKAPR
jgi:hypothetical protein